MVWHYTSAPCSGEDRRNLVLGTGHRIYHSTHHRSVLPCAALLPVDGHMLQIIRMTIVRDVTSWGSVARFPFKAHVFSCAFSPATMYDVHVPWTKRRTKFPQKDAEKFVYLGTTLTSRYYIRNAMTSVLYPENACYHWVHNRLCSSLLSENIELKMYRTTIIPVFGCETWS